MIDAALRSLVRQRAVNRCEYCHIPEQLAERPFHVEHIVARQHGGESKESNLALACDRCNLHKGPNLASIDPQSGQLTVLFHPRRDEWLDHFRFVGPMIVGGTATGRATVAHLQMNVPQRLRLRATALRAGEFGGFSS